jgi:hypothetical protein
LWARTKQQQGEYDAAVQAYEQQLKVAHQLGESGQVLLAEGDMGITLSRQGKYPEALKHFEESYTIAKSLGSNKNIALSLTHRAEALGSLGRYDEASGVLAEAATFATRSDASKNVVAWFHLAGARMALSERKWQEAEAKATQALSLAGAEFKDLANEAARTRGLARMFAGTPREGRLDCERAVKIAQETREPSLLAESLLALAQADIESGDSDGALKASLESQEMLSRLGKPDYEWIALLIAARASQSKGQSERSMEYATRAESLLKGLQQRWGADNYNSYLKRQDIQFYRKWLSGFPLGKPVTSLYPR